mmetsp:Transcript_124340/g.185793  ORF Transcript_124340/g.185793 Transcript_124340/m.185793 type:complete len:252 (-) Transcript_124340:202-957(-)
MPETGQNYCSYISKLIVMGLAVVGIIFSWISASSCEFISFVDTDGNPPDRAYDPPFNTALAGSVGIFKYEITDFVNGAGATGCIAYEDRFAQQRSYPSLATAQFCALIAPILAGLAVFANLFDTCACNFAGSYLIGALLYLAASGLQMGTFTLLADPAFCFEDVELECGAEKGAYFNGVAGLLYFIAACLICCIPRADPFCFNFGAEEERPKSRRQEKQPTVIVQPIIVKDASDVERDDRYENSGRTRNRR